MRTSQDTNLFLNIVIYYVTSYWQIWNPKSFENIFLFFVNLWQTHLESKHDLQRHKSLCNVYLLRMAGYALEKYYYFFLLLLTQI